MNIRGRTVSSIKIPPKRPEYFTSEREQKLDYIEVDECLIRACFIPCNYHLCQMRCSKKISFVGTVQSFCAVYLSTYLSDTQPLWSMLHHITTAPECVYDQWYASIELKI
ncbi:hypothetical protein WUBG_16383 [Wuchereria bancrofti]|uniref:Uncharacterized protein n=1 Tax=Wuchereria bancrofti TaxID=6293 RepID=J9E6V0_WUCBA|nr:hypothetical protein WUBG_16383 [Wuchereria bancrofti]